MRSIALLLFQFVFISQLAAQVDTTSTQSTENPTIRSNPEYDFTGTKDIIGIDTTINDARIVNPPQDTTLLDSVAIAKNDSIRVAKKSDIETTINYTARDSMTFDLKDQKLFLYGDTYIDYGSISLKADQTIIDWNQRTIKSKFTLDTLGRKRGKPIFAQGSEVYETEDILYNFKTKRAIIKGVVTEQDGAFMHGEDVKKNEENELFIKGAKYTTCNLSDPHFFIESEKIKVVPGNKVVSGPFNMKFREVPTPLWFPFGMFPQPRKKASGIVFPSYGEENRRGFFLRDGGYYFGFSEYADLRITGDIYSKGGHAINTLTNYKVRYKFNGSLSLSYNKNVTDNTENPLQENETNDYWIRWSHRPETRGNSSFSASVNAGTTTFNANNNVAINDLERSISSKFTSNISYSQKFRGTPFNMSANLRHNQDIQTGIFNMTLPGFTLNMNRIYPLKGIIKSSKSPLAKLNFSHNFVATNEFSNAKLEGFRSFDLVEGEGVFADNPKFSLNNLDAIYDRAKIGGRHTIPVSTSFNMLKYFTVSPSFNYQEVWYTRELDYNGGYNETLGGVDVDTLEGFSRAGSWTSGASMNTRVYGMYYLKGIPGIEAVRHVMTPSLSFSYNPDFSSEKYGVYETIQIDSAGRTQTVSKYEGFAFGSPTGRESKTIGFSLTNNLEMKVRTRKDTANEFKKVKVFDNLSMNTGYNLAADSFNLSNISWNARTSFFQQKVSVTMSGNFDPYLYVEDGTNSGLRVNRFAWNNGEGLGTLQSLNTAVSFSLSPKKGKKGGDNGADPSLTEGNAFDDEESILNSQYGTEEEREYVLQNPDEYVDFNLPWSLRVSYSVSRRKRGLEDAEISAHTMSLNGTLGLTGKTQITFNTNYDVKNQAFATTRIGVSRDLHCWTMNFSWVPFGRQQSFALTIRPKSSLLQDLKLEKRRSFYDFFRQ